MAMSDKQFLNAVINLQNSNNRLARQNAIDANNATFNMQKDAQNFNSREAQKNRSFQLNMSNTAHQREVRDLIRAGLNPVLSANNGAAVSSGATASSGQGSGTKADMDMQSASLYSQWLMNKANNAQALKIAKMNNQNAIKLARISAGASMYGADASAAASRFGALQAAGASMFGSQLGYDAQVYGIDKNFSNNEQQRAYEKDKYRFEKYYENSPSGLLFRVEQDGKAKRRKDSGSSGRGVSAWNE